ncbi:MAG: carbohydrate ABC transporter permease [Chloroflexota bacterium]
MGRKLTYLVLTVAAVASVAPFVYMLMASLKTYGSVIANNLWPWPPLGNEALQFQNYPTAIETIGRDRQWGTWLFVRYLANSLIVAAATVFGVLLTSTLAAYALARIRLPGQNILFILVLTAVMVPEDLTTVPKVVMMFNLQWYNTYAALIVPFTVSVFGIFLLRQFFMQIPRELYEAAVLDGVGHVGFLFRIVLPLSRPILMALGLLTFVWSWDNFKWPLLVTRDASMRVMAVGLQQFIIGEGREVQLLMAFATLVAGPVIVLYFVTQKYFKEGILTTGLKG